MSNFKCRMLKCGFALLSLIKKRYACWELRTEGGAVSIARFPIISVLKLVAV